LLEAADLPVTVPDGNGQLALRQACPTVVNFSSAMAEMTVGIRAPSSQDWRSGRFGSEYSDESDIWRILAGNGKSGRRNGASVAPDNSIGNSRAKGDFEMYRSTLAPKTLFLAVAVALAACTPVAEALAPQAPPDDVASRIARRDQLEHIKDETYSMVSHDAVIARLDQLAALKDGVFAASERDAHLARLDYLAQIKDEPNPVAVRNALIARLDQLTRIKDYEFLP
jgi:hypothetical protein